MSNFKEIDVNELNAMLTQGGICLVDVRTETEMAQGMIGGAQPLPLHLLPVHLQQLDANQPTVFYCRLGGRSAQAAAFAAAQGFNDVYNLVGGITAWAQAGLPVRHAG